LGRFRNCSGVWQMKKLEQQHDRDTSKTAVYFFDARRHLNFSGCDIYMYGQSLGSF
jgi:hypothetical protein